MKIQGIRAHVRGLSSRHIPDTYAHRAQKQKLRSRAAYKLEQINCRFRILSPKQTVLDLGASPGGFSLIAAREIRAPPDTAWRGAADGTTSPPRLLCVDVTEMMRIRGAMHLKADVTRADTRQRVRAVLRRGADVVLCDVAPATTGVPEMDHFKSAALCRAALRVGTGVLKHGGRLVIKIFSGVEETEFKMSLNGLFTRVNAFRPKACRARSREVYYVARGYKGQFRAEEEEISDLTAGDEEQGGQDGGGPENS